MAFAARDIAEKPAAMWPPPETRHFSTRNQRKGKSKKGGQGLHPTPSSAPAPPPSAPPAPATPPPAPPSNLFPRYSSSTSTPLPPSMPKKRFFRRALPFLVTAVAGAYMLWGNSWKEVVEKGGGTGEEVSSVKAETM